MLKRFRRETPPPVSPSQPSLSSLLQEVSSNRRNLFSPQPERQVNPDELIGRKGIRVYGEMCTDDAVKAALAMKKHAVLSTGWDIEPATQEKHDVEVADFVKWNFTKMEGSLDTNLQECLSALTYGFSLAELTWRKLEAGPYTGKVGLKAIKSRLPHGFVFVVDGHDNLLPDGIEQYGKRLPVDKFVAFSYQNDHQNHYGISDLRPAYRPYWLKQNTWTWMGMFLDRYSVPLAEGIVPSHAGIPDGTVDDVRAALENLQAATTFVHSEDIKLAFPTSGISAQGSSVFERTISLCDLAIARSLLLPNLLGLSAQGDTGSFGQAKKHFDVFILLIEKLQRDLAEGVMGEQVIRRLVDLNYHVEEYPKFVFLPFTETDKAQLLSLWFQAIAAGAATNRPEDEAHIRMVTEFPEVSIEDLQAAAEQAAQAAVTQGQGEQNPIIVPTEEEEGSEENEEEPELSDEELDALIDEVLGSAANATRN